MVLECSAYLRPPNESRVLYIEKKLEEVYKHYSVTLSDKMRFIDTPEIQRLMSVLFSVNMDIDDIVEYLGNDFALEWKRGDEDEK